MVDKSHIGMLFKSERVLRQTQEDSIRKAGATWILDIGVKPKTWRDAISQVLKGDTVYLYALVLLPTIRGADSMPPAAQVAEFLTTLHIRGGLLVETYTGRKSDTAKHRQAMIKDAVHGLRLGGRRLPDIGKPIGRPSKDWPSPEAEAEARRVWASPHYSTREAAMAHMPPGVTVTMVRRLGPRLPLLKKRKR